MGLYERNADWTMTVCSVATSGGECPKGLEREVDFPTALRQHLEAMGYISGRARPVAPPSSPGAPAPSAPQIAALPPTQIVPPPSNSQPPPERRGSTGTGFFASAAGHVVTNAHVIEDCQVARVRPSGGVAAPARILARDAANDLALLETDMRPTRFATIRPAARLGEAVAVFGFPLSRVLASSGNFTLGNITALAGIRDDTRFFQISAPVQPGNSGGPLLDENGNVIGVVTSKLNALRTIAATGDVPQNVNFAIRASGLVAFLESRRILSHSEARTTKLSSPDLADQANAMSVQVICE
jgi:S1-C subfamily serine protease